MTPELAEMIPVARPVLGELEVEAVRRVILSGWVTQGPEVAAFEEEFADVCRRRPRLCGLQLHDRTAPCAAGCRRRPGRRSHHRQPLLHRYSQRHPPLRCNACLRRRRNGHVEHGPGAGRGSDHAAYAGNPLRPSARHAL